MVKYIKRTTDNKFLQSIENDIWVEDKKNAFSMTYKECETNKELLLQTYITEQIKEVIDFTKSKLLTREEKTEFFNSLKKQII